MDGPRLWPDPLQVAAYPLGEVTDGRFAPAGPIDESGLYHDLVESSGEDSEDEDEDEVGSSGRSDGVLGGSKGAKGMNGSDRDSDSSSSDDDRPRILGGAFGVRKQLPPRAKGKQAAAARSQT